MSPVNRNTRIDDGIVFHIRHRVHVVYLLYSEPVQDIRHQSLKSRIFNSCDTLCSSEILRGIVAASLAGVVD